MGPTGSTQPDATSEFLMATSPETLDLLRATAEEMARLCSITLAEAVARINYHWCGLDLSQKDDLILHEDDYYWALSIYFRDQEIKDWSPLADRSTWVPRPVPPTGSRYWTL
ncbi:hypothetical protein AB0F18_27690 [Streptomyces sp. NPDC029216]|uniref:hypothetical protein n=1 Tax=Streptomyces sp. NPDC029216 TaxID=3154701 RepID=UPI00340D7F1B